MIWQDNRRKLPDLDRVWLRRWEVRQLSVPARPFHCRLFGRHCLCHHSFRLLTSNDYSYQRTDIRRCLIGCRFTDCIDIPQKRVETWNTRILQTMGRLKEWGHLPGLQQDIFQKTHLSWHSCTIVPTSVIHGPSLSRNKVNGSVSIFE